MAGTQFYNCDFHIHTPVSKCYKDKTVTADAIVKTALDKGLNAIAITDHNSHEGIADVMEAAKGTGLVVFPGFELTAEGGHLIALFDPNIDLSKLDDVLTLCGINKSERGKEDAIGKPFREAVNIIVNDFYGITIAAHVDGVKGFLKTIDQGQLRMKIYSDENLFAMEIVDLVNLSKYVDGKERDYSRKMPCVQGSDAHRLEDIGTRTTLIKMQHISVGGLRQAFNDPTMRISFPSTKSDVNYPYIKSITVDKGFLSGQVIEFNSNFNCLLGGAGSGKSTIIEFLRFAFDQMSESDQVSKDSWGKLRDLAGVGAAVRVVFVARDGEEYFLSRTFDDFDNPISVRTRKNITPLDVDMKSLLPVHAYSQGEAVIISRDRRAQLELIDKHIEQNLSKYEQEIRDAYTEIESQVDGLVKLDAIVRDRSSYEKDIETCKIKIDALNGELNKIKETQKNVTVTSHQLWIDEKNYLINLVKSIDATKNSIETSFNQMELPLLSVPVVEKDTPNKDVILRCKKRAEEINSLKDVAFASLLKGLEDIGNSIKDDASSWKKEYQKHEQEYAAIVGTHGEARSKEINDELEFYSKKRFEAQASLAKIDAAQKQYQSLLKKRSDAVKLIQDQKKRISILRENKVKEILKAVAKLKIVLMSDANRDEYKQFVSDLINMKGSRQKPQIVEAICNNISPLDLANIVRNGDADQINNFANIGEWAQKILEQLRADSSIAFNLEAVKTEDYLDISFEVEKGDFRPLEKLSIGQKATVIVSLSLVEGSSPIIFDQPEDALYSPFIFEYIVKLVRASKNKRQFIFATHNPNIAVGSDLDLGIILESSSTETSVRASGGLDDLDTKNLVVLHLEGGEEAIRARLKEYGL